MKIKPLLLIIPFVLVFSALLVFDAPDNKASGADAGKASVAAEESVQASSASESSAADKAEPAASGETEPSASESAEPAGSSSAGPEGTSETSGEITLSLLIGQKGSLEDDPGIPVYSQPDETSKKLGSLQFNCCVLLKDAGTAPEGWAEVELASGKSGFVETKETLTKTITISDPDKIRMDIVGDSLDYLGLKFSRYGKSLTEGIDCSNFIMAIYALHEIEIPDTCNEQIALGKKISRKDARPGDVVYYDVNSGYGHVGIYLADGFLINATGHAGKKYPDGGVRICDVVYRDREEPEFYDLIDYR